MGRELLGERQRLLFYGSFRHSSKARVPLWASPLIELMGMQTLVVSSNEGSRRLVEEALQSWGATVSVTRDEESALTVLTEVGGGENPHSMLFLDLGDTDLDQLSEPYEVNQGGKRLWNYGYCFCFRCSKL